MSRLALLLAFAFTFLSINQYAQGQGGLFRNRTQTPPPTRTPAATGDNWSPFFNPEVPTLWHQLGVPQTFGRIRQYRDARINKDGLSPGKERKPQLLKLADPANLKPEAPEMLKVAAQIKMDQDLAPQKLKALKYICSIGCSCYNKKSADMVEKALLEAMEDCTVEVRMAAVQAVLANASGQSQCGCGDTTCNAKTCCSQKISKLLKKIAYDVDDSGCHFEPDAGVRSLAEQALMMCPPIEEKKDDDDTNGDKPVEGAKKDKAEEQKTGSGDEKTDDETTDEQTSFYQSPYLSASSRRSAADNELINRLEITGRIISTKLLDGQAEIVFDKAYDFPEGMSVVVAIDANNASFGSIIKSETGKAIVVVDDAQFLEGIGNSARVRMGVYE